MSKRIWFGLPWWSWASFVWGGSLLLGIVFSLVGPKWTLPNNAEEAVAGQLSSYKHCDNCHLFDDGFYLNILRKDQCEAPHFTQKVSCDIKAATKIDPAIDNIRPSPTDPAAACTVGTAPKGHLLCITGTVLEPQNTWSNYGYILAGILILFSGPRLLGLAVGVNFCLIGVTSGLYHATLGAWMQAFDVASIYGLLLSVIIFALECIYRRYSMKPYTPSLGYLPVAKWILAVFPIALTLFVAVQKYTGGWVPDSTIATILLIVALACTVSLPLFDSWLLSPYDDSPKTTGGFRWNWLNPGHWVRPIPLIGGLRDKLVEPLEKKPQWLGNEERAIFGIAMGLPAGTSFLCRLSDGCGHPMCSPHSFIQAHAVWHTLSAVALWCVYDFFCQASSREETMVKLGAFAD